MIPLVFFYIGKLLFCVLFLGFLHWKGTFVHGRKISIKKYPWLSTVNMAATSSKASCYSSYHAHTFLVFSLTICNKYLKYFFFYIYNTQQCQHRKSWTIRKLSWVGLRFLCEKHWRVVNFGVLVLSLAFNSAARTVVDIDCDWGKIMPEAMSMFKFSS